MQIIKTGLEKNGARCHRSYFMISGNEVTNIPIAGVGNPVNELDGSSLRLNFASRNAAKTVTIKGKYLNTLKKILLSITSFVSRLIIMVYNMIPGTTPKVTMSASESNCFPTSEYAFSVRAMIPSIKSNIEARKIMVASMIRLP